MPIYTYFCSTCNKSKDDFRSFANRMDGPTCKKCGRKMAFVTHPQDSVKKGPRTKARDVTKPI